MRHRLRRGRGGGGGRRRRRRRSAGVEEADGGGVDDRAGGEVVNALQHTLSALAHKIAHVSADGLN